MTEEKEGFIGECLKINNLCAKLIIANNLKSVALLRISLISKIIE